MYIKTRSGDLLNSEYIVSLSVRTNEEFVLDAGGRHVVNGDGYNVLKPVSADVMAQVGPPINGRVLVERYKNPDAAQGAMIGLASKMTPDLGFVVAADSIGRLPMKEEGGDG